MADSFHFHIRVVLQLKLKYISSDSDWTAPSGRPSGRCPPHSWHLKLPFTHWGLEGYLEGYQRTASPRPEGELLPIAYRIAPLNGRLK